MHSTAIRDQFLIDPNHDSLFRSETKAEFQARQRRISGPRGVRTLAASNSARLSVDFNPTEVPPAHQEYELLGLLHQDESAIVYEAYQKSLDRYVAIRTLHPRLARDDKKRTLFLKQARFLASVANGHLLTVYDVDEARCWVVSERTQGSLADALRQAPLTPDQGLRVLREALRALEFLHENHQVHGEISPAAILIDQQHRMKLSHPRGFDHSLEFCKPASEKYLAPELLAPGIFGAVGPSVDLYCLGFTVLEAFAGPRFVSFFKGVAEQVENQNQAWARWHSSTFERLPPVKTLLPRLPNELAHVLDRLLEKKVDQRLVSAREALAQLEEPGGLALTPRSLRQQPSLSTMQNMLAHVVPRALMPPDYSIVHVPTNQPARPARGEENAPATQPGPRFSLSNLAIVAVLLTAATLFVCSLQQPASGEPTRSHQVSKPSSSLPRPSTAKAPAPESSARLLLAAPLEPRPNADSLPAAPSNTEPPQLPMESPAPPDTAQTVLYEVVIDSWPAGAAVEIDARPVPGSTPLSVQLPAGKRTVRLRRWGCEPWQEEISVARNMICRAQLSPKALQPRPVVQIPLSPESQRFLVELLNEEWRRPQSFTHLRVLEEAMTRITASEPVDPRLSHALALLHLKRRNLAEAARLLEDACRHAPPNWHSSHRLLIWVSLAADRDDRAWEMSGVFLRRAESFSRSQSSDKDALDPQHPTAEAASFVAGLVTFLERSSPQSSARCPSQEQLLLAEMSISTRNRYWEAKREWRDYYELHGLENNMDPDKADASPRLNSLQTHRPESLELQRQLVLGSINRINR